MGVPHTSRRPGVTRASPKLLGFPLVPTSPNCNALLSRPFLASLLLALACTSAHGLDIAADLPTVAHKTAAMQHMAGLCFRSIWNAKAGHMYVEVVEMAGRSCFWIRSLMAWAPTTLIIQSLAEVKLNYGLRYDAFGVQHNSDQNLDQLLLRPRQNVAAADSIRPGLHRSEQPHPSTLAPAAWEPFATCGYERRFGQFALKVNF